MKLSYLAGKEIINIHDGGRLGVIGETDLVVNRKTGEVESIIVPSNGKILNFWREEEHLIIPWPAVKKIGSDFIIVDLDQSLSRNHSPF